MEAQEGYWWHKRMTEEGFVTPVQGRKGYDRIPANPDSPSNLFFSPRGRILIPVLDGLSVPASEYLGNLLKEYMLLLIEALRHHNNKIESSTFPILVPTGDCGASTKAQIMRYVVNSDSLWAHLRTFKAMWETNRDLNPELRSYAAGPAQWVDEVITTKEETILQATTKINEFDIRTRQLRL